MSTLAVNPAPSPPPSPFNLPPHNEQGDTQAPPHNEQGDIHLPPHNEQGNGIAPPAAPHAPSAMLPLATGLRINRGADDPAGLISSENLRAALASLEAESQAFARADAVASVAEGAMAEVADLLAGAHAASITLANDAGLSPAEREAHTLEVTSARESVQRVLSTTTFNGVNIFDGTMTLHARGASLAIEPVTLRANDPASIATVIDRVATLRAGIGAFQQNVLAVHANSAANAYQHTAAANSIIRDTDYGAAVSTLARARLLDASRVAVASLALAPPRRDTR